MSRRVNYALRHDAEPIIQARTSGRFGSLIGGLSTISAKYSQDPYQLPESAGDTFVGHDGLLKKPPRAVMSRRGQDMEQSRHRNIFEHPSLL